ncbi:dienelactone hydrolase family-domain-containing protein [Gongronella butleri]|nr:dienelactone hydrolase family-domain-containing protein [Gongronella butleri]
MASSYSQACCNTKPVTADYTAVGTFEQVGDLRVYVTGPADAKHAILFIYDIYGMSSQAKQFADRLAEKGGFKVVIPDYLQNDPLDETLFGDRPKLFAWIQRVGSIEVITPPTNKVVESLRVSGVVDAGIVGFCWGAKIATQYAAVDKGDFVKAVAQIHPSMIDIKDAEACPVPNLLIPTKDEEDMVKKKKAKLITRRKKTRLTHVPPPPFSWQKTAYHELLQKKFGDKTEHHRFEGKRKERKREK